MDGAFEHQETYLRDVMAFIGVTDVEFVRAEKTGFGPEAIEQALAAAREQISGL